VDWCIALLSEGGIGEVVINTSYRADQLEAYLASRQTPHIRFSREEPAPLETGGGIVKALPMLGSGPFLAMNSDALFLRPTLSPIAQLEQAWGDDLDFLMLLVPTAHAYGWEGQGDFIMNERGEIRRPQPGEEAPYLFTGMEIIHPRVFEGCPSGAFSLSSLWRQRARADGFYNRIRAVVYQGDWLNVGDLAGLAAAERYLVMGSSA
jgi:MurNAc alpha-1-phosphate uridylyltransferase